MKYSFTEENYLKAIFHLQVGEAKVTTSILADKLQTKPASVTDMMKKLHAKKLLHYKPYYGFSLSNEGKKIAINIIRRHRLWEYFLAKKLAFNWEEVHSLAEELEHVSSKKLIDRLDAFLGFPQFDPHGDPIPDSRGKMKMNNRIPLLQLRANKPATVCQVTNQSPELLEMLHHKNISIGTVVELRKIFEFDESVEVKIGSHTKTISKQLAGNIFVNYEENS